ncbi:MAG: flagellar brake protein [Lachnospiraceae bacterium]|nr:flagellar brake protein [Lachnospiraceae bacterium]
MLSKYVMPGDRIEIAGIQKGSNQAKKEKVYQSQVYDILSEDRLEVVMPMEKTKIVLLPIGGEYEVYFYTKGGLYQCCARIVERYKSNNVYLIAMELISNLSKYQRREFYRLGCAIDARIRNMTEEEEQAEKNLECHYDAEVPMNQAIIVDISGGGVRCVGMQLYEEEAYVYVRFHLLIAGTSKEYTVAGTVLQARSIESRPGAYEHRIKFENIKVKDREEIIRYIFDEERKYRKKERGE